MKTEISLKEVGDTKTLIVLEGNALEPINPKAVNISGDIKAVGNFLDARSEDVNVHNSHVEIDKQNGKIVLFVDANLPTVLMVDAKLYQPEHLKKLGINETKFYR